MVQKGNVCIIHIPFPNEFKNRRAIAKMPSKMMKNIAIKYMFKCMYYKDTSS